VLWADFSAPKISDFRRSWEACKNLSKSKISEHESTIRKLWFLQQQNEVLCASLPDIKNLWFLNASLKNKKHAKHSKIFNFRCVEKCYAFFSSFVLLLQNPTDFESFFAAEGKNQFMRCLIYCVPLFEALIDWFHMISTIKS